jgi:hypothetical protein
LPFPKQCASGCSNSEEEYEEGVNLSHDGSSPEGWLDPERKERRVKLKVIAGEGEGEGVVVVVVVEGRSFSLVGRGVKINGGITYHIIELPDNNICELTID